MKIIQRLNHLSLRHRRLAALVRILVGFLPGESAAAETSIITAPDKIISPDQMTSIMERGSIPLETLEACSTPAVISLRQIQLNFINATQELIDVLLANFVVGVMEIEQRKAILITRRIHTEMLRGQVVCELQLGLLDSLLRRMRDRGLRQTEGGIPWAETVRNSIRRFAVARRDYRLALAVHPSGSMLYKGVSNQAIYTQSLNRAREGE